VAAIVLVHDLWLFCLLFREISGVVESPLVRNTRARFILSSTKKLLGCLVDWSLIANIGEGIE